MRDRLRAMRLACTTDETSGDDATRKHRLADPREIDKQTRLRSRDHSPTYRSLLRHLLGRLFRTAPETLKLAVGAAPRLQQRQRLLRSGQVAILESLSNLVHRLPERSIRIRKLRLAIIWKLRKQ